MFCKNCGREIDQKTLKKLMENKGEPVVCSKCKQPLDNAEICGGFWGLIASAKEKEAEDLRAGGTTLMLDENGRPVQMGASVQKRPAPAAAEADRERAKTGLGNEAAPQNSGEYRGAERSASSYSRNDSGIQPRRSGARKNNTELWITRAIAILLGICLIISLIRGCGHDQKRSAPDTPGVDTTVDKGNKNGSSNGTSGNTGEETEDEPGSDNTSAGNQGAFNQEEVEGTDGNDQNTTNEIGQERTEEEDGGDSSTSASALESETGTIEENTSVDSYDSITDTILVDGFRWSRLMERKYENNSKEVLSYEWFYVDDSTKTEKPLEKYFDNYPYTTQDFGNGDIKEYRNKSNGKDCLCIYNYSNDYLKYKRKSNNKDVLVEYKTLDKDKVQEIYIDQEHPLIYIDPVGKKYSCGSVIKTYENAEGFLRLKEIQYFNDRESKKPIDSKYKTIKYNYKLVDGANEIYEETYVDEADNPIEEIIGNGYEYNKIRYTYEQQEDGPKLLKKIEYRLDNQAANGPNGFSFLEYEHEWDSEKRIDTRKAHFYKKDGKSFCKIKSIEPMLSDTVIPGYYAEEYPCLMGRPDLYEVNDSSDSHQNRENGSTGAPDYDGSIIYQ